MESRNAALRAQLAARLPVAHTRPGWLPQGTGLAGLDDLAAEHRRLLGVSSQLGAELHALQVQFDCGADTVDVLGLPSEHRHG